MHSLSSTNLRRHGERGSIVMLAAVAVLALVGIMVLAVDLGYLLSVRGQLQNGVDAGALAAAAALRVAIEPTGTTTEQDRLVRAFAQKYAALNYLSTTDQIRSVNLASSDITLNDSTDPPRVVVRHRLCTPGCSDPAVPTIFAAGFNLPSVNMSAAAVGAVTPVDGGTGMISGCWRPLLLPDTFFDANGSVWAVSGTGLGATAARPGNPFPNLSGDYYRSRFATTGGARTLYPFVDSWSGARAAVTSIRDARTSQELKLSNGSVLLGQLINFRPSSLTSCNPAVPATLSDYRVIDFAASPGFTNITPSDLESQAREGVCTSIRVGQQVRVYSPCDTAPYEAVSDGLASLWLSSDAHSTAEFNTYHYVTSANFPTPNTHPRLIPVLLFNPYDLINNPGAEFLTITNVGVLYVYNAVGGNPNIYGYFMREVVTGGMNVQPQNAVPPANNALLPMAVQLNR